MDKETEAHLFQLGAKVAGLETLVETLLVEMLHGFPDPQAAADQYLESVFNSSVKNHDPRIPPEFAEAAHRTIEGVVKRATEKAKRK
jgi:hypothetical protein